jgi:hypothetical protein
VSGQRWRVLIGAALTLGLLVLCVGVLRTSGHLSSADPSYAALALAAAAVGNVGFCAARWRILQDPAPLLTAACRRYVEGLYLSVLVPGGIAGDVYRTTAGPSRSRGTAAVLADRAIGGVVTLAAALPVLFLTVGARAGGGAVGLLVILLVVLWRLGRLGSTHRGPRALAAVREALAETLRRPRAVVLAVLLSVAYLLLFAMFLYAVVRAVGVPISVRGALLATPLVGLAGMLPNLQGISPSHAVLALAVTREGGDAASAGAAAGLTYAITLALAVVGGALLLRRTRESSARHAVLRETVVSP